MRALAWSVLAASMIAGCVGSVPLTDKPCPCVDGFVCCVATNQCLRPDAECTSKPGGPPPVCGEPRGAGVGASAKVSSADNEVVPISCNAGNADPSLLPYAPQFTDVQRSRNTTSLRGFTYRDGPRGMNLGEDMNGSQPRAATVNGDSVGYS